MNIVHYTIATLALTSLVAEQAAPSPLSKIMNYFLPTAPEKSALSIGVITIEGPIETSMSIVQEILNLVNNPSVEGILLIVDSPGGSAGDGHHIAGIISRVGDKKPFVCFIPGLAASAGYHIAAACPYIIATPISLVGSIGSVMEFARKEKSISITSGKFKRAKYVSKGVLDPEHEQYYQDIVNDGFELFCDDVARWRSIDPDTVRAFDARIFTARKGLELKLVDALGTIQEAVAQLYSLVRQKSGKVYSTIELFDKAGTGLLSFPVDSIEALIASSASA